MPTIADARNNAHACTRKSSNRGPLGQAAGGGFEAAENSFLQPIGHCWKQKSPTDVDRRFSAVEHPPALLEGGGVEPAEFGELVRQTSSP